MEINEALFWTLDPETQKLVTSVEKGIKEKYMSIINNLSVTELKSFNNLKHGYKNKMLSEMKVILPDIDETILHTECHYISNALSNQAKELVHTKKRHPRNSPQADGNNPRNQPHITGATDIAQFELNDSFDQLTPSQLMEPQATHESTDDERVNSDTLDESITRVKVGFAQDKKKTKQQKKRKSKGTKTGTINPEKNAICFCNKPSADSMTQCNWCQEWFHDKCVNLRKDDNIVFWICHDCRVTPKILREIQSNLSSLVKCNMDLVSDIAAKTVTIQQLKDENDRLREMIKAQNTTTKAPPQIPQSRTEKPVTKNVQERPCTKSADRGTDDFPLPATTHSERDSTSVKTGKKKPSGTFLIGSSIIKGITEDKYELDRPPMCIRGGTVHSVNAKVLLLPKDTSVENVILQVGSNDCMSDNFKPETFKRDYISLVKSAQLISENVVISGLVPRVEDKNKADNMKKANDILKTIASDETLYFVDNEDSFVRLNGGLILDHYQEDGVHLSVKGTRRLADNLGLKCKLPQLQSSRPGSPPKSQQGKSQSGRKVHHQPHNKPQNQGHFRGTTGPSARRWGKRWDNGSKRNSQDFRRADSDYKPKTCWFCGEDNHISTFCRYGEKLQCYNCGIFGHKARLCMY